MMKRSLLIIIPFAIITIAFVGYKPAGVENENYPDLTDSVPEICTVLPGREIDSLKPFGISLTNSFTDPNNFENYAGCHYQFFTPDTKPQMAVRLIKWSSKTEAGDEYRMNFSRAAEGWGGTPERIYKIADSAYFNYDGEDTVKCDECGLVALQGLYTIYIGFKGGYEEASRGRKKFVALQILQMMYDRIPGLAPSRIHNTINK